MKLASICITVVCVASANAAEHPLLRARDVLACLHPTARYVSHKRIADAWDGAGQYGADQSEIDRIYFAGALTYRPYALDAAVVWRNGMVRVVLLGDTAAVPPNDRCGLLNWNG